MSKQSGVCFLEISSVLIYWLQSTVSSRIATLVLYDFFSARNENNSVLFLLYLRTLCNFEGILLEVDTMHSSTKK